MLKKSFVYIGACTLLMSGCARSVAVERVQMKDTQLSCAQLLSELQDAGRFRKEAEGKKGVTGTNTAAVLFFWPALFVTYGDANEAIRAADERKVHLTRLYHEKSCDQPSQ